jgi:hypothetical protein
VQRPKERTLILIGPAEAPLNRATSSRNAGRNHLGTPSEIKSEGWATSSRIRGRLPPESAVVFRTACRSAHGDRGGLDRSRRPGRSRAPAAYRFAADSLLEGDGFEPSVRSGENYAHETAPLIATAFPFGRKADSFVRGTVRITPFGAWQICGESCGASPRTPDHVSCFRVPA